jgi:hypothetical protein
VVLTIEKPDVDLDTLRGASQDEYALVADDPAHGFHFLVGRPVAHVLGYLGYEETWLQGIPEPTIASFAGTGNPVSAGRLLPGERVVHVGTLGSTFRARTASSDEEGQQALAGLLTCSWFDKLTMSGCGAFAPRGICALPGARGA